MNDYKKYQDLINGISFNFSRKYNLDFDELRAESNLIYCEIVNQSNIQNFDKYLYSAIVNNLKNIVKKEKKEFNYSWPVVENNDIDARLIIEESFESLPDDTKEVIDYIIDSKTEIKIKDIMSHFKGRWPQCKIKRCLGELKSLVNE